MMVAKSSQDDRHHGNMLGALLLLLVVRIGHIHESYHQQSSASSTLLTSSTILNHQPSSTATMAVTHTALLTSPSVEKDSGASLRRGSAFLSKAWNKKLGARHFSMRSFCSAVFSYLSIRKGGVQLIMLILIDSDGHDVSKTTMIHNG